MLKKKAKKLEVEAIDVPAPEPVDPTAHTIAAAQAMEIAHGAKQAAFVAAEKAMMEGLNGTSA